jgi:hypothetical protein
MRNAAIHRILCEAIAQKRKVTFMYDGSHRVAEPHDYGIREDAVAEDDPQLLYYQTAGESRSGGIPKWRYALLSKISDVEMLNEGFRGTRPVSSDKHTGWKVVFASVTLQPGVQKPGR